MSADFANVFASRGWEVPAFNLQELEAKNTRFAIVIPVINEGVRIQEQLRRMNKGGYACECDIIIADGGSTDGSLAPEFLSKVGVRAVITKQGPGKLSAQLRCAYAYALIEGYEGIITIDGNGKDSVDSLPAFVEALKAGVDYAQASRFRRGGKGVNTPISRLVAIRLIHAPALSIAGRRWLTDTTQGFRAYSARYLLDDRVQPFRAVFKNYELLAYLTARAGQLGYNVKEIPTTRTYPAGEPTPTKIRGIGAHSDLLTVLWETLTCKYNPEPKRSGLGRTRRP